MRFDRVFIPYGGYWSTPFVRWQGSFAHLHPILFAAEIARRALDERGIPPTVFDGLRLGMTVPARHAFFGAPWFAGLLGAEFLTGPTISQACATAARVVADAAAEIEAGGARAILTITCDRTSNGPHIYYPNPLGPGGTGESENWVWDNFFLDPYARNAQIETAERVARENGFTRKAQEEVTLLRYAQYQAALADDAAFQRRYMVVPIEMKDPSGRKPLATVTGDEGIHPTTAEGLARLAPVLPEGTVTYGTQTHPADGNCGMIVATRERAEELGRKAGIRIQLLAFAQARVRKGYMPEATAEAAKRALAVADLRIPDLRAIKTHNPFAVNDLYFAKALKIPPEAFNHYGSSLVYGHPQAPTGMRLAMELIEELVLAGGGYGLFSGCAAGDSAAALVLRVD
ncbi:MAG: thiolase family protein [Armatimonadota bacterium]|nr:thiolase family protein [Armatimonadota bacterium]MDR7562369.1 thiolase family protein [Armatimonadota bacterium]MDR7567240.1 thiolase family protein [Armatimonadota bacterium]MDR7601549.1 thiolase family protein [Armatimonadota bacterium]